MVASFGSLGPIVPDFELNVSVSIMFELEKRSLGCLEMSKLPLETPSCA